MHILILPSFYPEKHNEHKGVFFKDQVKALSNWVLKINVVYLEQRTLRELSFNALKQSHFQFNISKKERWSEYRVAGWNIPMFIGDFLWVYRTGLLIDKYIRINGKPDIIHVHNVMLAGIVASKISKKYDIPFVVTEHDSAFLMKTHTRRKLKIASKIYKEASKVMAVSDSLKIAIEKIVPELNIDIIPNIVNPLFFLKFNKFNKSNKNKDQNITRFISIGNLNKNKGHLLLLEAFSIVSKKESISLRICGEGEERNNLTNKINELGLKDKVELLGYLNKKEIYNQLNESDCLVHSSYFETFGVVLIEALSTGTPIVSTKSGGPQDIFEEEFGYMVEKGDTKGLSDSMLKFIKNKEKFKSSKIKEKIINRYGDQSICLKIKSIYSNILRPN